MMDIYRERAYLTSYLSKRFPSYLCYSDPDEPNWAVLYVDTPEGQLSWHINPDDMDLFSHLSVRKFAQWDGHTTEEKYERLSELNG
jgi:hypothetical protein